jgi:ADP-ribosylglycohydrolase
LQRVNKDFSNDLVGKSLANGSAMRVSPIAWAFNDIESVLIWSEKSAITSHDHSEAII